MDRTFRGFIAGVAGGISMEVWDLTSYYFLKFGTFRFLDWAAMMIYGERPESITETIISFFIQILWAGFIGIIFAFLIPRISSKGYLLKGLFYGFITFFIIYSIPVLFQVPHLKITGPNTQFSHFIGSFIFGVVTALTLHWLDNLSRVTN